MDLNKNNSSIFLFENEINKNKNKSKINEYKYYSAKKNKKSLVKLGNTIFNEKKVNELSKKNISKIIINYLSQKNTEQNTLIKNNINNNDTMRINDFNNLNNLNNINNANNVQLKLIYRNEKKNSINKLLTNNNIINDNYSIKVIHSNDKFKMKNIEKNRKILSAKYYSYYQSKYNDITSPSQIRQNPNKKSITKNINLISLKVNKPNKKASILCDVGTNTDF